MPSWIKKSLIAAGAILVLGALAIVITFRPVTATVAGNDPHLTLKGRCFACHFPLAAKGPKTTCAACHPANKTGGKLHRSFGRDCSGCHKTHRRNSTAMISTAYRHQQFSMRGHGRFACDKCHESSVIASPDVSCKRCHEERAAKRAGAPHLGTNELTRHIAQLTEAAPDSVAPEECSSCHRGLREFSYSHRSDLSWFFILDHSDNEKFCRKCHIQKKETVYSFNGRKCELCHESLPDMGGSGNSRM